MWYWSDGEVAPDIEKCTAACEVNSSIGDLATVDQTRIMLTTDLGLLFDCYYLADISLPQTVLIQMSFCPTYKAEADFFCGLQLLQ